MRIFKSIAYMRIKQSIITTDVRREESVLNLKKKFLIYLTLENLNNKIIFIFLAHNKDTYTEHLG